MTLSDDDARLRLTELEQCFADGDYGSVRAHAPALVRDAAGSEVRAMASALLAKTQPDPALKWLFLLTLGLIVVVTAYWFWHAPHGP